MSLFVGMRFSSGDELQAVITFANQAQIKTSWEDAGKVHVMETGMRLCRCNIIAWFLGIIV